MSLFSGGDIGGSSVLESPADSDDLFNLKLVRTATVDVVSYSCEGRDEGPIDCVFVREQDGHLNSPECFCVMRQQLVA